MGQAATLISLYHAMRDKLGPSHWWPGDSPFEIAIGAILTQNTNWQNVEKALGNLKKTGNLTPEKMYSLSFEELSNLIHPAGYYNIKTRRIKNFLEFLNIEASFDIENLASQEIQDIRPKILGVNGIGPETADAILLYALQLPVFVVDAYTQRILHRHDLVHDGIDYHELQALFMDSLPQDVSVYNEFHALIVRTGKQWCKKKVGVCDSCPLQPFLFV
ncbi:endonuclease III domain-containing protein [Pseudodesulfovibrio piezophilus]|uniref:HhH-GPD domain-containing protein n=1 Tax=Pseudodesulfovibrio piezophilus (strain DSM 21447 / JCM 15486 / C1TLV30) TaxID=1322246 RepID=M1WQK5_PSEP2|nr:hypothetical protein [Pseudodesulfovibrio piezophilus]CCH47747.1 conserved protein of unknown function [Pseudodesulfovibrio piezophilus C1TLV30]